MSTKNLLKATVASFLFFGLSTISANAMEPAEDTPVRRPRAYIYIATGNEPSLTKDQMSGIQYKTYLLIYGEECKAYTHRLSIPFLEALQEQEKLLKSMQKDLSENGRIAYNLAVDYVVTRIKGVILDQAFFYGNYASREYDDLDNKIWELSEAINKKDKELPVGLRDELDLLSEPFKGR